MYVWYLKISHDPDHVADRKWYQIESEHIQRRLGTIRKFLRRLGGAWHVKTSPIGNALRKPDLVGYSCVFCEGASPSPFQVMTMCRACLQRAVQELHIPGGYISVAHLDRARAGTERKMVETGAPIENTCKTGKIEKICGNFFPKLRRLVGTFSRQPSVVQTPGRHHTTPDSVAHHVSYSFLCSRAARGAWRVVGAKWSKTPFFRFQSVI